MASVRSATSGSGLEPGLPVQHDRGGLPRPAVGAPGEVGVEGVGVDAGGQGLAVEAGGHGLTGQIAAHGLVVVASARPVPGVAAVPSPIRDTPAPWTG